MRERAPDLAIVCKAWPVRAPGDRFAKTAFHLDWDRRTLRCPNQVVVPFGPGGTVRFPRTACAACPLRERISRGVGVGLPLALAPRWTSEGEQVAPHGGRQQHRPRLPSLS